MNDDQYEQLMRAIDALAERVDVLEQHVRPRRRGARSNPAVEPERGAKSDDVPELESRIGAHLLNRLGIIALLIGASYFLKYAFDNQWIGPAGRVLSGLAGGLAVVVCSEFIRRRGYAVFSYSLKAVGLGVLYLSVWASAELYQLIPNELAFIAMCAVTVATVLLSLWENAEIIAAFAAVGAFITPVALATGENQPFSLFLYIAVLDAGAVALTRFRPWVRVLLGSFVGSAFLYAGWHAQFYKPDQFGIAFGFVSAFFAMFLSAPLVTSSRRDSMPITALVLANGVTYFLQLFVLLDDAGHNRWAAAAAVMLAAIYLFIGRKSRNLPAVLQQVHWTIAAALWIVAVPIGLQAQWMTLGWIVESSALVWVSRRTHSEYLQYAGSIALALGLGRLVFIDRFDVSRLLFNERMATFAVAIGALAFIAESIGAADRAGRRGRTALILMINLLAFIALNEEIQDAWRRQLLQTDSTAVRSLQLARDFAYSALWMVYGVALMLIGFWKTSSFVRWQALVLITVTVGKVFLYDTSSLDRGYRVFILLALGIILMLVSFFYQRRRVGQP